MKWKLKKYGSSIDLFMICLIIIFTQYSMIHYTYIDNRFKYLLSFIDFIRLCSCAKECIIKSNWFLIFLHQACILEYVLKYLQDLAFHRWRRYISQSQCIPQIQSTYSKKSPSSSQRSANLARYKPAAPNYKMEKETSQTS